MTVLKTDRLLKLRLPLLLVLCLLRFMPVWAGDSVLIENVPHVRQLPDFCGEACVSMYLQKLGHNISQEEVFTVSGLEPVYARGCHTPELAVAIARLGFRKLPAGTPVNPGKSAEELEACWLSLLSDLRGGTPSIVCMHYDDAPDTTEHFRLILGYDAEKDEAIYHEPALEKGTYLRMKKALFIRLWPLKYRENQWTVIRLPLVADKIVTPEKTAGFSRSDFVQHVMRLKPKAPKGFHYLVESPFVVIGDLEREILQKRAQGTVRFAVTKLKELYFEKDPKQIYDVWLFGSSKSYRKYSALLFNDDPDTPYGYFSPADGALVMNIATGGGTLVHEITHCFIESNFPDCPTWFNEGLASLYEQSSTRNGQIVGLTNWRLAGTQKAIREKRLPLFKDLCATSRYDFYERDKGNNYGQARYLCYYLQENGLLPKFYHAFREHRATDPTGYHTLQKILGVEDMEKWQPEWESWLLALVFARE
jgi:hypothetical protein